MRTPLLEGIRALAEDLNRSGIPWQAGSSVLLWFHGLEEDPGDLDLFFPPEEEQRVMEFFQSRGTLESPPGHDPYRTRWFYQVDLAGVEVDLMGGFALMTPEGICRMEMVPGPPGRLPGGQTVPLGTLEEWLVLYCLMGREHRVRVLERHLSDQGIRYPEVLRRFLAGPLSPGCRIRIERLLKRAGVNFE